MNLRIFTLLTFSLLFINLSAQTYSPYTLGASSNESMENVISNTKQALTGSGFEILGEYMPADDGNRWIVIVSNNELKNAVKSVGDLTGFGLALRVGITKENGKVNISYTTPYYWGIAYFRDDFSKVQSTYDQLQTMFESAMKNCGTPINQPFGSEDGVDKDDLDSYRYMYGMPRFDDTVVLNEFDSYDAAVRKIDSNLSEGVDNLKLVYSVALPGKKLKVYGIGLSGPDGEGTFLPTIDIGDNGHTAFLPYEILVKDNQVHMLHGRYRIALSFPDLGMVTFTKIMSTPGNIESLMESATR